MAINSEDSIAPGTESGSDIDNGDVFPPSSLDGGDDTGERESSDESRFKDGEELSFIRVRFPGNARSFPFLIGRRKFNYGQKVVAMSDRGMTVGYINSFPYAVPFNRSMLPIRSISKVATEEDLIKQKKQLEKEKEAERLCVDLIEKNQLDMILTHVQIIQFGKKAVFYFIAPSRVDFRDLVKGLVTGLKMRIELRQISVRDRTAAIGAIGPCGLQTCCSSFLKNYGNVSIKMAKNQNLALIPSKINGVCGQIKCCIKYEDDVYTEKRDHLPREGAFIMTENGDKGKVLRLNILPEEFEMITDRGVKRRYAAAQFGDRPLPEGWKFPDQFDHVSDETSTLIGAIIKKVEVKAPEVEASAPLSGEEEALPVGDESEEGEGPAIETQNDSEGERDEDNDNDDDNNQDDTEERQDRAPDNRNDSRPQERSRPEVARGRENFGPGQGQDQGQGNRDDGGLRRPRRGRNRNRNRNRNRGPRDDRPQGQPMGQNFSEKPKKD